MTGLIRRAHVGQDLRGRRGSSLKKIVSRERALVPHCQDFGPTSHTTNATCLGGSASANVTLVIFPPATVIMTCGLFIHPST